MNHLIGPLGNVLTSTPAPTNVIMSTFLAGSSGVTVTWTASTGATSYTVDFYSNTTPSTSGGSLFQTLSVSTTTATSTNILGGARYYYAIVRAVNSSGLTSSAVTSSSITTVFTSVTGLFVWLDSQDPTSYTLSGSTLTSPGWIDKVTSLAFRPKNGGASNVVTSSTNYPTISNPGTISSGIYFPNASSTPSSASSVGIQANLSSAPLIFPTQNMTFCMLITNTTNNNTGIRCCLQASKSSIASRPNCTVSFHTNVTEGFSVLQDNDGSTWGRALNTNQPTHTVSKQILIGTSSSSSTTVFQNGTSIVSNTTTYTSTYTNYNIYNLGIAVNNNGSRCWEGTVHEIMIFNKALTNAERIRVEGYLAWKCGINTSLPSDHPYRNNAFIVTMGTYTTGDTSISVSWDAVSGATSYTVKFYSNSTATTSGGTLVETNANTDVSTTSRTSTFTLVANTYYYASVTTINYGGTSSEQFSSSTIQTSLPTLTGTVTTFAGSGSAGSADGNGTNASFNGPYGVAIATDGTVYVADGLNNRIRKITSGAAVTTWAGSGTAGSGNGIGTNASFYTPVGLALATDGTLYVADTNTYRIRKITSDRVVSTFAGSGTAGFADGNGTNASFNLPRGVALATDGTVYVTDRSNCRIRKISSSGVVSTFAGSAGSVLFGSADGTGTSASFNRPDAIAVATDGTVYVADTFNNRIRKISSSGDVSTFAGSGSAGSADGNGTNASFYYPYGVAIATDGTVYVADTFNHRIRKITRGGAVSTIAGSGTAAFAEGTGTNASFNKPYAIAVATDGTVYVGDSVNHRIRKIT